ncbi:hypothetical protein EPA93_11565 [Ktedonosporobacter rubrisoli]|uniref:Cytochrome b561 domain-containing protein n=1 Tax=Ktedonosporobacter rubrisoli TaxID=2509675 RepID=A0A4P6JPB9_KTERU|nr:hypothetical protein [Ktedonosporobacter rubrisoli]QBD76606.1 hypothetical protein EPA93_11565 [Ktedonosporobacter rubrisoli]
MKTIVNILHWIGGLAGLGVLALGLFIWISGMSPITLQIVHALLGLTFVLALLILGIIAVISRETRLQGIMCIVYAPLVPIFGMLQMTLLVGDLHWLIRGAHLLIGLAAFILFGTTGMRYLRVKEPVHKVGKQPQLIR